LISLTHHITLNANHIGKHTRLRPKISIILGSGLGGLADALTDSVSFPYQDLPNFPATTVAGHRGRVLVGKLEGVPVILFDGRIHFYEGHPMSQVVFPVYVAQKLGANSLLVTNAAGGINPSFRAGTIMLIRDHINMTGTSPLIGLNATVLGPRFPSMIDAYDPELRDLARRTAAEAGIAVEEGVYVAMIGPQYETDAELRMLSRMGADAVGMSTVPEVIAARHAGMRVLGISVISNAAVPRDLPAHPDPVQSPAHPSHDDVQAVVAQSSGSVLSLLRGIVRQIGS
jgi:purine-nucleoside phosphorylase